MTGQSLVHTFRRYRSLRTHRVSALPVVILMPHSACNCRCVMCDIWKDNQNLKQLNEADVEGMIKALKKFGTQKVVMSGGEALLNPKFFRLCEILQQEGIGVSLLSTGLLLKKHAAGIVRLVDDLIVSLDGDRDMHDAIRNIPGAYDKLKEGIQEIRRLDPLFPVTGRCVIHRLNFRNWKGIIDAAHATGLDQISFLPADVSSHAFNREVLWGNARQEELLLSEDELGEMKEILTELLDEYAKDIEDGFIAEPREKLMNIWRYYAAFYGMNDFPFKKCNAPWVSTVIEADGTVRPCFFHEAIGNIHQQSLEAIINSENAVQFRKNLDTAKDPTCAKCVCYLNLRPGASV